MFCNLGDRRFLATVFVAISCAAVANWIAADLFVRRDSNLPAAITVMVACADGLLGVPFLAAFTFRERPVASSALAASAALCVPAFFSALFRACGIDQPVLLVVLSVVWFFVCAAIAPLVSWTLAHSAWFEEPASERPPGEWKVSPPILAAECCLCHENRALPATLFTCGHAFACTECFPEIIENNLQACPFCRCPRI